jgi:polysaccharide pyruvyl transferase WcaK-like protein
MICFDPRDIRWKERAKTIRRLYGGEVAIQGAYGGSNIGDLVLGEVIKSKIKKQGCRAKLFGHPHTNFSRWDYLVIGGGGILYQDGENNLEYRMKAAESVDNFSVHGVGAPILTEMSKDYLEVLEHAHKVSVRDEFSKKKLGKFIDSEIKVTADPVFALADNFVSKRDDSNIVGVNLRPIAPGCIRSFNGYNGCENYLNSYDNIETNYIEYCRSLWDNLNQKFDQVVFLAFDPKDADFARCIGIEDEKIRSPLEPRAEIDYISENINKIVTTRYHALIFSLITGTDVKIISYAPKVSSLAERIGIPYKEVLNLDEDDIELEFTEVRDSKLKNLMNHAKTDFQNLLNNIGASVN